MKLEQSFTIHKGFEMKCELLLFSSSKPPATGTGCTPGLGGLGREDVMLTLGWRSYPSAIIKLPIRKAGSPLSVLGQGQVEGCDTPGRWHLLGGGPAGSIPRQAEKLQQSTGALKAIFKGPSGYFLSIFPPPQPLPPALFSPSLQSASLL